MDASYGVLVNDSDIDGDSFTAELVSDASMMGSVSLNADGSFTYSPADVSDAYTDEFTYLARDEHGAASNIATVSIYVESMTPR
jgi:large repetitive protein